LAVTALAATLVLRVLMTCLLGTPHNMNQPATTWPGCPATVDHPDPAPQNCTTLPATACGSRT